MFFGSNTKTTTLNYPSSQYEFLTSCEYIHVFYIFKLSFGRQWQIREAHKNIEDGRVSYSIKPSSRQEFANLIGHDPVDKYWPLFNQSLFWFIAFVMTFSCLLSLLSNYIYRQNIFTPPFSPQIASAKNPNPQPIDSQKQEQINLNYRFITISTFLFIFTIWFWVREKKYSKYINSNISRLSQI
jgi:hypothetical protein